jgi:diguanylate cyclase (GGDEF)-like protein
VVARLGGDEFVVVLQETAGTSLQQLGDGLREALAAQGLPASVGVASYPHCARDADGLVRHADVAMFHAKAARQERSHVCPDSPSDGGPAVLDG